MYFPLLLPLLLALRPAVALCASVNKTINWFSCTQNGTLPLTCGTLVVPLDYLDTTSNATLELQLVKVNATKQPKKGSILFNPGGPGDSGRGLIAGSQAEALMVAAGGVYDLIGFDTRYVSQCLHNVFRSLCGSIRLRLLKMVQRLHIKS